MQQDKSQVIFDPNQVFPVPFTLISNIKKSLTSLPLKQPFGYQVYCPLSCKKIKIGVVGEKKSIQAMQFNTTSSRCISVNIHGDIKYLVNQHYPTKKDKKKATQQMLSVYIDVQDRGNVAIFNPFYIDSEKPLSLYTFDTISKTQKPSKDFHFDVRKFQIPQSKTLILNNNKLYLFSQRGCSYICTNENFDDISDNFITIIHPKNKQLIYRDSARDIKQLLTQQIKYWLHQFNEHHIWQQTGKQCKLLQHNIDIIYQKLSFYLNIDEQLRIKLSTTKNKQLLKQLYSYHPRMYNAINRLCSFINYGNTKHDVFKLADLGFFNRTDMLQDLAYVQSPHVAIPTAQENGNNNETESALRQRTFPYTRMNRCLPFPNFSLQSCINAFPAQTVARGEIIWTQITDPYVIFVDVNKRLTAWSCRFAPFKLFELDLIKQHTTTNNNNNHKIITIQTTENQPLLSSSVNIGTGTTNQTNDLLGIGDIFHEQTKLQNKPVAQEQQAQAIPDQTMLQQLLSMGYKLSIVKQALINVKNESVAVALDEIQKLIAQQKKHQHTKKNKIKPKQQWQCLTCTLINPPTNTVCEMCSTQPEFVDEQAQQIKRKQQQQKVKKQQQAVKQAQRAKLQKQAKLLEQQQKKQLQLQKKKHKQQFMRRAEIRYCKLIKCSGNNNNNTSLSSINPFIIATLFIDPVTKKSLLKLTRMGYNRQHLTQYYRYQNKSFISNYNRQIYQHNLLNKQSDNNNNIQTINRLFGNDQHQQQHMQVIGRLVSGYIEEEFVVLQQHQVQWENMIVENVQIDGNGQNITVVIKDQHIMHYAIQYKDTLQKSLFTVTKLQQQQNDKFNNTQLIMKSEKQQQTNLLSVTNKPQNNSNKRVITKQEVQQYGNKNNNKLRLTIPANTTTVVIQLTQHLSNGQEEGIYNNNIMKSDNINTNKLTTNTTNTIKQQHIITTITNNTKPQPQQLSMSEFIPIMIEHYQGSIFSSKYHPTSLFQRNNLYISNYPQCNFTFKHLHNKHLFVQNVVVVSQNKRLQKIYPIETGLVFTANQLCYFVEGIKLFKNFTKQDYAKWLQNKRKTSTITSNHRQFWQPVAFVQLDSQSQTEIEYKRAAKYVFFLPTGVRTYSQKVDVAALKIDFFGVKGRVEDVQEEVSVIENFKEQFFRCEQQSRISVKPIVIDDDNNNNQQKQQQQKDDSLTMNKQSIISNATIKHRQFINTISFLPKSLTSRLLASDTDISITTVYEIRIKNCALQHQIEVDLSTNKDNTNTNNHNIYQITVQQHQNTSLNKQLKLHSSQQQQQSPSTTTIHTYTQLLQQFTHLNETQITTLIQQKLQPKQFVQLILRNQKSFRTVQKILKIVYENVGIKLRMFDAMAGMLPQLCTDDVVVTEVGLKAFLRVFDKLAVQCQLPPSSLSSLSSSLPSHTLKQSLLTTWQSITNYITHKRNPNYTIIRNKYNIEQLILQPQLFSKDYYRLIHPNYIQQEVIETIVQQPKTEINNLCFVEKQNGWWYKTYIQLKQQRFINSVVVYFPKLLQSANRYKLCIKLSIIQKTNNKNNNQNQQQQQHQVFYRYWNEQMLYQFTTIAYKDKQIYCSDRVNCFTIDVNMIGRVMKLEYSYLLLTTINTLKYKQPTESLVLYPIVKSTPIAIQNNTHLSTPNYPTLTHLHNTFPTQAKHSQIQQNLPPVKYTTDRHLTLYQIYQFPIINHQHVTKQFTTIIDKIGTNIMDQKIVQQCVKSMKISQYKLNAKGLDFAYTLMIKLLKMYKKLPNTTQISVELLLQMFDTFVVYEIGPIMKKVMSFITENYRRLSDERKVQFVTKVIERYLQSYMSYKQLKQSEKYSLTKVIQKLQQLQLPTWLLVNKLQQAHKSNNLFLVSMLLKLIRPNLIKFGYNTINEHNDKVSLLPLKHMLQIVFKFNLWVLDSVQNIKIELLTQGMELFQTLTAKGNEYSNLHCMKQQNKNINNTSSSQQQQQFINQIEQQQIWKLVFLTLRLKNQQLNKHVNFIFKRLVTYSSQTFKKSLNRMLLQIIKKQPQSMYCKINNGAVNDDLWMNHLQTILEYLDVSQQECEIGALTEELLGSKGDSNKTVNSNKRSQFILDVDTAISLLQLPLTPTLWSHALLIIPKEDKVLNAIIKNFKKQYYSSLGKQLTKFCQPLAGIRSLDSIHINWLDLVKKIRLQNRSIFSLFIEELRKSTFGGKQGVAMAATQDVKQLEITSQFLKLVLQKDLPVNQLNEQTISEIFVWYFLNNSIDPTNIKAQSPASQLLKTISQHILQLIKKLSQHTQLTQKCIKCILTIKQSSQKLQTMFEQKRLPTHSALSMTKRFCKCFQELMQIFMSSDEMSEYFAFGIDGLGYVVEKLGLVSSKKDSNNKPVQQNSQQQQVSIFSIKNNYLPQQEFLLSENILSKKTETINNTNININIAPIIQIKTLQDLKEQQFANNIKIVPTANSTATTTSIDWTVYKKGNKTKVVFLSMTDPATYFEYPLFVELAKTVQIRSIKIGFPCASFQYTDKIVVSPSSVLMQGSIDGKNYQPLGEMMYIDDDGYLCNGVKVFALNLQKVKMSSRIDEAIKGIQMHRVKYLKIVVKRPLVTFIQGQYSQLNGRLYNNVGVSISFLSVMGDDLAKLPSQLIQSCKQMSKKSALNILKSLLTQSNLQTMKKISNKQTFSTQVKQNFHQLKQLMYKHKEIVPQIIYTLGSNNKQLGDWLIKNFIKSAKEDTQAKIINQIIVSTPQRIYQRINYFQQQLFKQFATIKSQSQVQSSLLYAKYVPFMQSFCKTLEQSYEFDYHHEISQQQLILDCDQTRINYLIDIYDRKHSSPDIKSLLKLLISLIWIRKPLKLAQQVVYNTLELIWKNCSESKPYFYIIMSALLVSKVSITWIQSNQHQKIKSLIKQIQDSLQKDNLKALRSQMFLLSILSYHQAQYLRQIQYHVKIYNALKLKTFNDSQIYDYLMKVIQNVLLGYQKEEEKFAALLISDVSLLVKRKDPFLQKLFVGLLAVEQQVMIHLKGVDIASRNLAKNKKIQGVPSKLLSKYQQKSLAQKLGKKFKYHLAYQADSKITISDMQTIAQSMQNGNTLIIIKVQRQNGRVFNLGAYCPLRPTRTQDAGDWGEQILADKNTFSFIYNETDHKFINYQNEEKVVSIVNSIDEEEYQMKIHHKTSYLVLMYFSQNGTVEVRFENPLVSKHQVSDGYPLIGFELFECKPILGNVAPESKLAQLLTKSNQAKAPFTQYRHNQIHIFPADITVSKLQKLLSSKISIKNQEGKYQQLKLKQIENQDFIIDVTIENPDDYQGQQDFGYIPKMNIFDSFSKLGGINQVLRLGSQSIKDWKNAERKKNFEHYMDQLKSFIHLPNFFSLFIKNHTYVTFLFEVASGMPDDTNSTRNWQEEEVNSSRFIYKILSDIFKFDRSKQLRDMNKYQQFCEIILQKLSQIAKQAPRVYKQSEIIQQKEQQTLEVSDKLQKKKTQQKKLKKKKGTGYGADNQNNSKWSSAEWLQNKKIRSQQTLRVVSIFVSFLDCEVPIKDDRLTEVIKTSCLLPLIESALRSSSLLQIAKQIDLFKCYLSIIRNMSKNPSTISCLMEIEKNYKPEQTESIHSLLGKLNNISEIFLQCLKSGKQAANETNQNTQSLALDIQKTFQLIDKAVRNLTKNKHALTIKQINQLPIQSAYRLLLQKLRFGYVDMKKGTGYQHCLHSSISTSSPSTQKILRLSQQLADLSSSLPCEHTNSIFVRCDKTRIDLIKILIMGSKDTPYSNGAFMFDLYCDDSYPNNPPKMVIATTGQGKIRFNPNLYSCGKVCLSLLGTWRGSASENWDPKLSTLLQLFISTQGITMSEDIYFNQPGFDGQQGTQEGDKKNQAYSNIVRLGNIRYAMIEQIKNPPKGFEDVVQRHFYSKKAEIIEQCEKWLHWAQKRQASYSGLVSDHNSSWCSQLKISKTKYKQLLQKEIQQLKEVLAQIPQPDLKQKAQQQNQYSKVQKKKLRKAKQAELQIDVAYDKQQKKEQLKIQENVMQDRWSRYIGAMGLQAVKKQSSSNVLLIGLKPLGLEIAKNLILSGLQKLTIIQNSTLQQGSTQQHFYMSDMKSKKIQQCIFKLKELNPYMIVDHLQQLPLALTNYHLIVSTLSIQQSLPIAAKCRQQNVKFVYSQTSGVSGSYFADFGDKFIINDTNGEDAFQGLIESITCEKQGVVKLLQGVRHPYQDGDYVVVSKVQGMQLQQDKQQQYEIKQQQQPSPAQLFYNQTISTQKNPKLTSINNHVFQIKVINWNSFSIGDTTKFSPYIRNGIVKNIKVPKTVAFEPFEECVKQFDKFVDANMGIYDFEKMGDNFAIFVCFMALGKFEKKHDKKRPQNWNLQQAKQFIQIVSQICQQYKKTEEQTKPILQFAYKFALISQAQLPTIGAYLGGIVSQQVIKGLTNKYTPINQFFTFQLNEMIQNIPEDKQKLSELRVNKQQEFRNIKIVIGHQNMNKIESMKLFVVGAGAIGCELLKNFAMVNIGSKGKITVTDPDHIQTSNLTRQFLFRQKHVKKPKSATAAAVLMQMNPHLKNHISARLDKVCQQTEDIYSDEFFKTQTIIANALDNVKARIYMDKRCVVNKVPLFESGTLGPKGHVQVIVPYKTENYGSQADPEEQAQIPHCTLKMFPEDLTHCIQWSRDIFGKIFTLNPKALKKIIDSKDITSIQGKQKVTVAKMIKYRPNTFEDCIDEAVRIFFKYFRNDIRQLLYTYPLNMKTKEGKLFWTLPKRPPTEISKLNLQNQSHKTFIASYAVLFAKTFSIDYPKDFRKPEGKSKIMEHAVKVKIEDFIPSAQKSKEIQQMTEKQQKSKEKMTEGTQIIEPQKIEQQTDIDLTAEILKLQIKPEQFQKDEDQNGHIDLIYSMSNLRAQNYELGECKWIEAKLKAGRIMAALSTTTSVVAAIQTLQIIKIVCGCETWRNAFVNLAVPLIQISEPGPAVKEKIGNTEFSVWQDWEFKAASLKDLLTQIKEKYEVQGFNISTSQGTPIFWQTMYKEKQQAQQTLLTKKLSQIIGKQKTVLNILFRDLKGQKIYEKVPKVVVQATQ